MNPSSYPINEIFASLQGEATFTGMPSIFIRLQGCDVGCPWCDTKHTWELTPTHQTSFTALVAKTKDKSTWAQAELHDLLEHIQTNYAVIKHVVITGGEPALYNLHPLCLHLESLGKQIQIETSGTSPLTITANTWVTLSPKLNMPGGKAIFPEVVQRANEIKMPIGKRQDITQLIEFIHYFQVPTSTPIWLQPLSQNPSATKLCIEQALLNNWRVSLQTHKFVNIR
ncbi:MAG: 7-carboxy-7-deazaguanine synthase QueE [Burkholderiales bacterium]